MSSSIELRPGAPEPAARHARLQRTATFRGGKLVLWLEAQVFVNGAGILGGRVAVEAARSGARVIVCDKDVGAEVNLGTQSSVVPGVAKARSVAAACNALAPGSARAICADVRNVGVGTLRSCAVLMDCSDDAGLAWPLTELSNGLDRPLLRLALDGSGRTEVGRVLTSAGGAGRACQLCPCSPADLARKAPSTPCPGSAASEPAPTLAGGALGMAIAGIALLQAQRLVTRNDLEQVLDRELVLDLTNFQLLATRLRRANSCLSRHESWGELVPSGVTTNSVTLAELFDLCAGQLGATDVALEPYGHPLALEVHCECGARRVAVGSLWSAGPSCGRCGRRMDWMRGVQWPRINRAQARELGILADTPASLGLPADGALLVARALGRPVLRLLFEPTPTPESASNPTQPEERNVPSDT